MSNRRKGENWYKMEQKKRERAMKKNKELVSN